MIIIILSTADLIVAPPNFDFDEPTLVSESKNGTPGAIFRLFRVLRIFKLATAWPRFNTFLVTIYATLKAIASFMVILYLFIFMFTILGEEAFA